MSWYAIDSVSDAFEDSKSLLFPFRLKRWVVLAVITFFVGGSGSMPSLDQSIDAPIQGGQMPGIPFSFELVLLLVLVVLALGMVFLLIGSILEFVFVDALRSRDVQIRGRFGHRTGAGLRLFGFRVALFLFGLVLLALVAAPIYAALVLGIPAALIALVFTVPITIVFGIALAVVQDFTTSFVVPLICERGGEIVATWRRTLWPAVKADWREFLLYIVLKWGLGIAMGFLVGIGLALVFFPVIVLVAAGAFAGGGVAVPILVVAGIFALALFVLVQIFIRMPATVFLRYYSLSVLDKSEIQWVLFHSAGEGESTA